VVEAERAWTDIDRVAGLGGRFQSACCSSSIKHGHSPFQ
jgi:hypothetical protein